MATSNIVVKGLDNIGVTETLHVPETIKTDASQTYKYPDTIKTDASQTYKYPDTIKTDASQTYKYPDTIKTDASSNSTSNATQQLAVDLKPVSLDLCLNTSSKLPQGCIHQPFNLHFGVTMFGMEMFGWNFAGESRLTLSDLPKRPAVEWPAQQNCPPPPQDCAPVRPATHAAPATHEHGLRVRIR